MSENTIEQVKSDENRDPNLIEDEEGSPKSPDNEDGQVSKNNETPDSESDKLNKEKEQERKNNKEYRTFADDKIRQLTEEVIKFKAKEEVYNNLQQQENPEMERKAQEEFDLPWIEKINTGGEGTIGFIRGALKEDNERRRQEFQQILQQGLQALRDEILDSDPKVRLNQDKIDLLLQKNLAKTKKGAMEILEGLGQLKTETSYSPQVQAPGKSSGVHMGISTKPADIAIDPFLSEVQKLVGLDAKAVKVIKENAAKEISAK